MFMGIKYGLKQSVIATIMGIVLKLFIIQSINIFSKVELFELVIAYMLIAFISSFVIDKKNQENKRQKKILMY